MPSALTVTFVQSTVLNALSNILAQLIDQRNNTVIIPISQAEAIEKEKKKKT
jgi:hypothetical protein